MKDDIEKKQKRYSYANIGKIEEEKVDDVENGSGSENSVDEDNNGVVFLNGSFAATGHRLLAILNQFI